MIRNNPNYWRLSWHHFCLVLGFTSNFLIVNVTNAIHISCSCRNINYRHRTAISAFLNMRISKLQSVKHHHVLMMESSLRTTAFRYNYPRQKTPSPLSDKFSLWDSSKYTSSNFLESKIAAVHYDGVRTALQGSANRLNDINAAVGEKAFNVVTVIAELFGGVSVPIRPVNETQKNLPITIALQKIQSNMDILDNVAGRTPQLSRVELVTLISTVFLSGLSPFILDLKVVEVLVPSMAAVSASIGISAEYLGKVAVSKSKEVAALAIQAAAESEILLACSERSKAILPLCVGIATTASAFSLLAPNLARELSEALQKPIITELYLICPLIAVLAAAVAGLATQECRTLASRATGLGNRRFASSKDVGRTWLSATEQVEASSKQLVDKWVWFAVGVLPAPLIAALCPGVLSFKAIICAAVAAAQAAYYLSIAEYFLASATEAVALKARSSAVSDTYANQSARAGSILPFTSALAGLCAAASAAVVELLPLISVVELQAVLSIVFPSAAALFAAAASVAKARCEVDALAASEAASKGLSGNGDRQEDPLKTLMRNIVTSLQTSFSRVITRARQIKNYIKRGLVLRVLKKWTKSMFTEKKYDRTAATAGPSTSTTTSSTGSIDSSGNNTNKDAG